MDLRRWLEKELLRLAAQGEATAIGWLALVAARSEKELFPRSLALLRRFLQDDPFRYHRNAGALAVARWLADRCKLALPEDFERRYEQLLEEAFGLVALRSACVLLDAAQIYLIAHAVPESLKPSFLALLRQERQGRPYRRIIFAEALRLHEPSAERPDFELDRLDTQDLIAYGWQHALEGRFNQTLLERTLLASGHYYPLSKKGPVLHPFLQALLLETLLRYERHLALQDKSRVRSLDANSRAI